MQPALLGSPRDLKEFLLPNPVQEHSAPPWASTGRTQISLLPWICVCSCCGEHCWDVCPAELQGCVTSVPEPQPGAGCQQGGHTSVCCAQGSKGGCAHRKLLGTLPAWLMPSFMPKLSTTCTSVSCSFPKAQFSCYLNKPESGFCN